MKFKLAAKHVYWWQIVTHVPSETKGSDPQKQTLQLQFEPMTPAQAKERDERVARDSPDGGIENDIDFLVSVTRGWGDVVDEDGNEAPFNEESYRHALQWAWFRVAALRGYFASQTGEAARLGN